MSRYFSNNHSDAAAVSNEQTFYQINWHFKHAHVAIVQTFPSGASVECYCFAKHAIEIRYHLAAVFESSLLKKRSQAKKLQARCFIDAVKSRLGRQAPLEQRDWINNLVNRRAGVCCNKVLSLCFEQLRTCSRSRATFEVGSLSFNRLLTVIYQLAIICELRTTIIRRWNIAD